MSNIVLFVKYYVWNLQEKRRQLRQIPVGWSFFRALCGEGDSTAESHVVTVTMHTVTKLPTLTKLDKIKQNKIEFVLYGSLDVPYPSKWRPYLCLANERPNYKQNKYKKREWLLKERKASDIYSGLGATSLGSSRPSDRGDGAPHSTIWKPVGTGYG